MNTSFLLRNKLTALTMAAAVTAGAVNAWAQQPTRPDTQPHTPLYTVKDLGPLGGESSESVARAINDRGQITGRSYDPAFTNVRAVFWANGSSSPAELIGGSNAYGINNRGQIVGDAYGEGPFADQAVFWANSSSAAIALLTPSGGNSNALEINNAGQIVGNFFNDDGTFVRVLFWNNSRSFPVQLSGLPGGLTNTDLGARRNINDAGQVVGESFSETANRATFWASSGSPAVALGMPAGELNHTFAEAISNNGQIVGEAFDAGFSTFQALYWASSTSPAVELGALGGGLTNSDAQGINNQGKIVGDAFNHDFSIEHATLWPNSSSPAIDLNTLIPAGSGWVLQNAVVINEKGEIAGHGTIGGHTHGFVLIPRHGRGD